MASSLRCILVWFRNTDLRLHDHEPVFEALKMASSIGTAHVKRSGSSPVRVLPFYCFDVRTFRNKSSIAKIPRIHPFRAQFLMDSVMDVRLAIEKLSATTTTTTINQHQGSDHQLVGSLLVRTGIPEEEIAKLVEQFNISHIFASREAGTEECQIEKMVEQKLANSRVKIRWFWTQTLVHLDDLPYDSLNQLPDIFTHFYKHCEKVKLSTLVRSSLPAPSTSSSCFWYRTTADLRQQIFGEMPTLKDLFIGKQGAADSNSFQGTTITGKVISLGSNDILNFDHLLEPSHNSKLTSARTDPRSAFPFKGGETEALKHLKDYMWNNQLLKTYKDTRNGLLGVDYSSKMSPWLSTGSLSPRIIFQELCNFESKYGKNESSTHFVYELLWRDFFRFLSLKYKEKMFFKGGMKGRKDLMYSWPKNDELFKLWCHGRTGYPFVDANMRELATTGWMSNRGRQNVASFLAHDLKVDWRMGAEFFEMILVDYDVASNWGNWNYVSGVGFDPRNRYFNVIKQGLDYDPDAKFIKTWIPELGRVPGDKAHDHAAHFPVILKPADRQRYGVDLYPNPVCIVRAPNKTLSETLKKKVNAAIEKQSLKLVNTTTSHE